MEDRREKVGVIGVDAGLCWVGDPCYILHTDKPYKDIGKDWGDFCDRLHGDGRSAVNYKQFNYDAGHPGLGVVVSTGYGDGEYPVYVTYDKDGCVKSVTVEFLSDDEKEEDYEDEEE